MRSIQRDRHVRVVVALLCVLGAPGALPNGASAALSDSSYATTVVGTGGQSRTDGDWLVWIQQRSADDVYGPHDLYGMRLDDRQPFPIAADPSGVRGFDYQIDGGVVVWTESHMANPDCPEFGCSDVLAMKLSTGETFAVAATRSNSRLGDGEVTSDRTTRGWTPPRCFSELLRAAREVG